MTRLKTLTAPDPSDTDQLTPEARRIWNELDALDRRICAQAGDSILDAIINGDITFEEYLLGSSVADNIH
ncbi:MAG: hypothetical protein HOC63_17780 [Rhodospirillales bacterium]|jgi:hypothetical protein|nr:hypothetical protein [Rhodospirillales bacterium]MBT4687355.1 hypothetical protein [Rhodospirillaceae bacterium]MBT5080628.1 hypothetical protein [Rhodospirillaceae bacterium]MBT5879187.1 hypothetical protein [Rhodospirillaceae bacterium]MBT6592052.1 hypothetical protein [Rhodospirillaceae bacterium]